jgi:NAD(P)H-dependent FMN reductase
VPDLVAALDCLRIGVILASARLAKRGETVARRIEACLAARPGVAVDFLDLREYRLPAYAVTMPPSSERSFHREVTQRWRERMTALDGYVLVTPEHNEVYPGQLKNAIEHVAPALSHKPIAIVSYAGPAAGTRAVEQLGSIVSAYGMVPITTVPGVHAEAAPVSEEEAAAFVPMINGMLDHLLWWAQATKLGRAQLRPLGGEQP